VAASTVVAAILLVMAALYLERGCRIPADDQDGVSRPL
jgi:hypothetical protein